MTQQTKHGRPEPLTRTLNLQKIHLHISCFTATRPNALKHNPKCPHHTSTMVETKRPMQYTQRSISSPWTATFLLATNFWSPMYRRPSPPDPALPAPPMLLLSNFPSPPSPLSVMPVEKNSKRTLSSQCIHTAMIITNSVQVRHPERSNPAADHGGGRW